METKSTQSDDTAIIMFDGVCNLCNSSVNFIIDRDKARHFRYAPLQSETGQEFLKKNGLNAEDFDSLILIEGDIFFRKSTAALRIAKKLDGLWPLFYVFIIIPPFLRNVVYDIIAKNRYKLFGKKDQCRIPTPELKSLFLN